jgi:Zn-dependent metalloprotease
MSVLSAVLALGLSASPAIDRFEEEFPQSVRLDSRDHARLLHASGFSTLPADPDPERGARDFLARHGSAFGIGAGNDLRLRRADAPGKLGGVRFSRALAGVPIFESDVIVGFDAGGRIFLVNADPVPEAEAGARFEIDRDRAIAAATQYLGPAARATGTPVATQGWQPAGDRLIPSWRVFITAANPSGDWRIVVNAQTGKVLWKLNERHAAQGSVFEISPVETLTQHCPLNGNSYDRCATPVTKELPGLTSATNLSGTHTSTYNCKGGEVNAASTSSCTQTPAAGGAFNFNYDQSGNDVNDEFAEVMGYYHVERFYNYVAGLDSRADADLGAVPGFVNLFQNGQPLDNAFFSPQPTPRMVFGQGSGADFAYDADVVYHEMMHAAVHALAQFAPEYDTLGTNWDPSSVNEGTADSMAVTITQESAVGEYDATATTIDKPFIRDLAATPVRTCRGDGTVVSGPGGIQTINGRNGEEHDDGEIWGDFYWETMRGLANVDSTGGCGTAGRCDSGGLILYEALRVIGAKPTFSTFAATMAAVAHAIWPSNSAVGDYVTCQAQRHRFSDCDGRAVPVYAGESKFLYMNPQIPVIVSGLQPTLAVTGASGTVGVCGWGSFSKGTIWLRKNQAVGFDPGSQTVTADLKADFDQSCQNGSTGFTIPASGTWYVLISSATGGYYSVVGGNDIASRPGGTNPQNCQAPSGGGAGHPDGGIGPVGDGGSGKDGGGGGDAPLPSLCGCGAAGAPAAFAGFMGLLALRRRKR